VDQIGCVHVKTVQFITSCIIMASHGITWHFYGIHHAAIYSPFMIYYYAPGARQPSHHRLCHPTEHVYIT